jgi:3-deoxy-D-manno-octulosonic-acid transferase
MIYFYNLLLIALFIPAAIAMAVHYRKKLGSEFFYKTTERLGLWNFTQESNTGKPILWVHCASLGEVKAVEPVLRKLSGYRILLTTVTLSGRQHALESKLADYIYFAPIDFSFLVRNAIKNIKISALLLVETELWPGLIYEASRHGTRVFLLNGRLSANSYPSYRMFSFFWKPVLSKIDFLLARSQEDAERFSNIGYPKDRIIVTGNIKYDNGGDKPICAKEELGFKVSDIIWVCGSTRNGENEMIASAWKELKLNHPELKLVVAPRHLGRAKDIIKIFSADGVDCGLRSQSANGLSGCLVLDTFGELWKFYSVCDVAFVGGSLVSKGGQNPIEPAAFSKPVLFGPHMENFATESRVLLENGGGMVVKNTQELVSQIGKLLDDVAFRNAMGAKAFAAVQSQKGAVDKTVDIINSKLEVSQA